MSRRESLLVCLLFGLTSLLSPAWAADDPVLIREAKEAMRKAATYYHRTVASHGGYVYHYSLDLQTRWGEGPATADQIWVQPPGTPTVGLALVAAYEATGEDLYLQAATDAALALVYGQLRSGGWTNCVDFDPRGSQVAAYRNGKGRGKNNSSLDDGQSQSAIRLLMHVDRAHQFRHSEIHQATVIALDALLAAQFPNGGFPQIWTGPVSEPQPLKATYPEYDWRTEGRVKDYWNMYTINDNVPGYVAETLIDAYDIYEDERFLTALQQVGRFLIAAQLPEPQTGWAQQYSYAMQPIWARKFEPPAVASDETQEALATLMQIYRVTGERAFVEPVPAGLAWLRNSVLADGQLARYYELKTNRPLYMERDGDVYSLTYDDSRLPTHYGWKIAAKIERLEREYRDLVSSSPSAPVPQPVSQPVSASQIRQIIADLDAQGRWVSEFQGEALVGQPKFARGESYLSSQLFSRHLTCLSEFVHGK